MNSRDIDKATENEIRKFVKRLTAVKKEDPQKEQLCDKIFSEMPDDVLYQVAFNIFNDWVEKRSGELIMRDSNSFLCGYLYRECARREGDKYDLIEADLPIPENLNILHSFIRKDARNKRLDTSDVVNVVVASINVMSKKEVSIEADKLSNQDIDALYKEIPEDNKAKQLYNVFLMQPKLTDEQKFKVMKECYIQYQSDLKSGKYQRITVLMSNPEAKKNSEYISAVSRVEEGANKADANPPVLLGREKNSRMKMKERFDSVKKRASTHLASARQTVKGVPGQIRTKMTSRKNKMLDTAKAKRDKSRMNKVVNILRDSSNQQGKYIITETSTHGHHYFHISNEKGNAQLGLLEVKTDGSLEFFRHAYELKTSKDPIYKAKVAISFREVKGGLTGIMDVINKKLFASAAPEQSRKTGDKKKISSALHGLFKHSSKKNVQPDMVLDRAADKKVVITLNDHKGGEQQFRLEKAEDGNLSLLQKNQNQEWVKSADLIPDGNGRYNMSYKVPGAEIFSAQINKPADIGKLKEALTDLFEHVATKGNESRSDYTKGW